MAASRREAGPGRTPTPTPASAYPADDYTDGFRDGFTDGSELADPSADTWIFDRGLPEDADAAGASDLGVGPDRSEYVDRDTVVRELFADQNTHLVRLAVLMVDDRETAQDLTQDAFLALYRRFDDLDDPDAALRYLRSCVLNGARSVLRRRRLTRRNPGLAAQLALLDAERSASGASAGGSVGSTAGADQPVLLADEHRQVVAALQKLPRRQREVIVLRYWAGLSEAEVARTLRVSLGVVKSSASRGRAAIATILGAAT